MAHCDPTQFGKVFGCKDLNHIPSAERLEETNAPGFGNPGVEYTMDFNIASSGTRGPTWPTWTEGNL